MKANFAHTAVAVALLMLTSTMAQGNDTQGWYLGLGVGYGVASVNVTIKNGAGNVVARTRTDSKGEIRTSSLPPGEYQMEVDGTSLIAAMDKVAPPAKMSSGPSVSIGGGMFGGGSRRSSSSHEGAANSHSSSGGVGVGIALPLGHGNDPQPAAEGLDGGGIEIVGKAIIGGTSFSSETPYCRDSAGQGMRIGFTVPEGTSSVMVAGSFGYKWANNK